MNASKNNRILNFYGRYILRYELRFNNFILIDEIDISKISSDQKSLFFTVSPLYRIPPFIFPFLSERSFYLDFGSFECTGDTCRLVCDEGYSTPAVASAV